MKNNKINKIIAILLVITLMIVSSANMVYAATDLKNNELLIMKGKTIYKTTTINEVNSMFGAPKAESESAFGGKIYSYTDDSYSYYLYLETNAVGKIMSYGVIEGNFKDKRYKQGDKHDSYYWSLSGYILSDTKDGKVYGLSGYNCEYTDKNLYLSNFKNNSDKYLYGLQQHAILVSKVLAKRLGKKFPHTYVPEDIFYMNEQLKYNNSDLYEYAQNNQKTQAIYSVENVGIEIELTEALPNPILLGERTSFYEMEENYKYVLYDLNHIDLEDNYAVKETLYIDPSFLEEKKTVELTTEEKSILENIKVQYNELLAHNKQAGNGAFEIEPKYDTVPLVAGKYNKYVLEATTNWINMARVGAGLRPLTLNEDIADAAQHKAVLLAYMSTHDMVGGHYPVKPDEVDTSFYQKAQSYMNENLFYGDIQFSVNYALNDGYGEPIDCGHRYNILDPRYTECGMSSLEGQGVHKFSGNASYNNEMVAWPCNGVMPMELIYPSIGNWTARFYKNYTVDSKTTVTIKNLNTDKVYEINMYDPSNGFILKTTGNYQIAFRDDRIIYEDGDVFEITLHNVKNSAGNYVEYKYRSAFKKIGNSTVKEATDISLDKTSIKVAIGQSQRIFAKIVPEDAGNKLTKFSSSSEGIAKVRQDGTITGVSKGKTIVTVKCGNITKTIQVEVTDKIQGDVNGDGIVTLADCTKILKHVKKTQYLTGEELQRADINGKDGITLADYTKLLKHIKNKEPLN